MMSRISFYRSLMMSAVIAGTLAVTSCGLDNHKSAHEQGTTSWNMARLAIIYQLAETQYKAGDYDKCTETLKEAFETKALFAPMHVLAAKVNIEKGNLEPAANYLNAAIRINAGLPEPYYLMGVIYQRWQKPEAACDYYNQAWQRKSDEVKYMLAVVEMNITLGRLDEAQAMLESKLVYFEQSAAVRVALARIFSLKNDYVTASRYYRDATILVPEEPRVRRSYAESLFYAGKYGESAPILEDIRKQPELTDRANVLVMLGQCYLGMRRTRDARECFQEAIRDNPSMMSAYLNLSKACMETGDLSIALSAAKNVLRLEPENIQAMILAALVQEKMNKLEDAAAMLEKASQLSPGDSTILCMLGLNAQRRGNRELAAAYYVRAAAANPKDPWVAELLGKPAQEPPQKASAEEPLGIDLLGVAPKAP
ncbi:MAG: tetratricopeptide repeat protein [Phycisphaerales bacterium]|nr:tetratricopeptide repeat protein [Phycisphaerales bacterium]